MEAPLEELMSIQRSKALAVEMGRLEGYLRRNSRRRMNQLLTRGYYRSLRRRILNIQQWDMREIDLNRIHHRNNNDWLLQAFAALDRSVFPHIAQLTNEIRIIHRAKCVQLASTLLQGVERKNPLYMWPNWIRTKDELRFLMWKEVLVYFLDRKPSHAMAFMQMLIIDPLLKTRLRPCILADALGHLSKLHLNEQYATDPDWPIDRMANRREFGSGFFNIYQCVLAEHPGVCSQDLLHNIAQTTETQDLKRIFDILVETGARFRFNTLLHYANVFAEAGEVEYALRCLDVIKANNKLTEDTWTEVVDRQMLRWTCALIVRKASSLDDGYRSSLRLVEKFVGMGVRMDISLYNVVMHNAMDARDYATAFKLYNALETSGLQPNAYTHYIMLAGCSSQEHPPRFRDFAQHCQTIAIDQRDTWLAAEYLHYVHVCLQDEPDMEVFLNEMWIAYLGIFDASALRPFVGFQRRYVRERIEAQAAARDKLLEPNPMALFLMLQTEIKYAQMTGGYQQVLNLYHEFQVFVAQRRHPVLTQLAQDPIIWNNFLLAFSRLGQYAAASHVIRTMLDHSPQPNVYSWNIFMQVFFKTGQLQAGERVFEIMRSRNVAPNPFSYSILLHGYARAQVIDRIGELMHFVDERELHPEILALFARIVDRDRMVSTLEQARLAKEAAGQKAATLAEQRTKRWSIPEYRDLDEDVAMAGDQIFEGAERQMPDGEQQMEDVEEQVRDVGQRFIVP